MSVEVHHIVPQKDGGPDTLDNAAAVCPNCHSDFGGNPEKVKRIKEMRDWWYEQVNNIYSPVQRDLIQKMSNDLLDINKNLPEIKAALIEFLKLRIQDTTPENLRIAVFDMIGATTTASASPSASPSPSSAPDEYDTFD